MLAAGKRADFLVLDANPLYDITNIRQIAAVYLNGVELDREALRADWSEQATVTGAKVSTVERR